MTLVSISFALFSSPHCFGFCHIFIPFQKQNKTPLSFDIFSLIYSSHHWLSLAERWPKLRVELCLYSLGNAKPALAREVQHLRSFSGLTAAFVSRYIWSKYLSGPLGKKKKVHLKSGKLPKLGKTNKVTNPKDNFQWEKRGEWFLMCVL